MSKTLTVADVKKFHTSPATQAAIAAVKLARKEAKRIGEHVDSYLDPAFATFAPFMRAERKRDPKSGERIENRKDLYLCGDLESEQVKAWFALCDRLHAENGYSGLEPGVCPFLTADWERMKTENALIALFEELIGVEISLMDERKKALELILDPPQSGKRGK